MNYFILISLSLFLYMFFKERKLLLALQQNFYNENNRYLKWGFQKISRMISIFDLILFGCNVIACFYQMEEILYINIWYLLLIVLEWENRRKEQSKIPLKMTSRLKRLILTVSIIYFIPILVLWITSNFYFYYILLSLFLLFHFFIVYFANILNRPIEAYVFHYYKKKALKKLKGMSRMDVIGVTGSYGKTSSKNILNDILSVKFNTFPTPKNYNTQYGLILTINNYLDKFEDLFIAEMGAFKKGRIKLLCDLVHPKYGIVTNIGTAHLETFGSRENIQAGKFELIESLPSDGLGILNRDDPWQVSYSIKNNVPILWIGIDNSEADIFAHILSMDSSGTKFEVTFQKEKITHTFQTKLLGKANVYNILAGIAFGWYKGMSMEELELGVGKIQPITHRLELKPRGNDTIIDDAYNSNPVGSKMALDVLKLMDGMHIVVTPGMIELGSEQYHFNKEFGKSISEVADYVILVGKEQTKPIMDGLMEQKYPKNHVFVISDVKEAFSMIENLKDSKRHTYILLENDLPDIYNE